VSESGRERNTVRGRRGGGGKENERKGEVREKEHTLEKYFVSLLLVFLYCLYLSHPCLNLTGSSLVEEKKRHLRCVAYHLTHNLWQHARARRFKCQSATAHLPQEFGAGTVMQSLPIQRDAGFARDLT